MPLVVRGPGFRSGQRSDAMVSSLDLLPTLVSAAGGEPVPGDGHPLQEFLDGRATRTSALVQISELQLGGALRTERHTYAVTGTGLGRLARYRDWAAEAYEEQAGSDHVDDPAQRHNLAGTASTAELRRSLAAQLTDEIERLEGTRPRILVGSS